MSEHSLTQTTDPITWIERAKRIARDLAQSQAEEAKTDRARRGAWLVKALAERFGIVACCDPDHPAGPTVTFPEQYQFSVFVEDHTNGVRIERWCPNGHWADARSVWNLLDVGRYLLREIRSLPCQHCAEPIDDVPVVTDAEIALLNALRAFVYQEMPEKGRILR